ncbi:MAG: amino acid adenylation domain-containing protein [Pseudacidovorax sp.]|nr:amino acid adenylation domain-containing protein [Pseudacidovorax sp.]
METKKLALAQRFAALAPERQKAFLALLAAQRIDFARLPIVPAAETARRGLSYVQARQWLLWQLDPLSSAYHISGALRLQGALDVPALRASFEAVLARHASLRTVFRSAADGQVEAVVQEPGELCFTLVEPAQIGEDRQSQAEAEAEAEAEAARLANAPFDLSQGPLIRVGLIRLAPDVHLLVLAMHHIVSDGASLRIVMREFVAQYVARVQGRTPALDPLPIQYADYAAWQRNWMEAGEQERQLAYWTAHVGKGAQVLQLPVDHVRRSDGRYLARQHVQQLPAALVTRLQQRAHVNGATLFMVLLAGWQGLLHRLTGQTDIRVGVPIANRHRPETAGLVGYFANTQVLRVVLDGRMPLAQLLDQVREAALGAQMHQDLPFEQLVEALQPERNLGVNPLFQVLFNHQRGGFESLETLPGLALEEHALGGQAAQLEMALEIFEQPDGRVHALWRHAVELFEPASIGRMARQYLSMLEALADHPGQALGEVALHDAAECARLLAQGSNAQLHDVTMAVPQLIARRAAQCPDAVAVVFGNAQWSYGELDRRANRLAHRLIALGVRPETPVGIVAERSLDMMAGLLGILKAGGAYVPLDPEYPVDRLAYMVESSGIGLLLAQRHQGALVRQLTGGAAEPAVLLLDEPDAADVPDTDPGVALHPEHLAYLIYTSGSTGRPKGVMVRHGAWSHLMASMRERPGITAEDVLIAVSSLSFDMASLELYLPLVCGARLVLAPQGLGRDGEALATLLRAQRATILQSTPSGWRLLAPVLRAQGGFPGLRGLCGGEALHADLAEDLHALGIELWNMYGPTETTVWSAADRVYGGPESLRFGSPIAGTRLHVLDPSLNLCPVGVAGELYLGGVGLARGYFARAGLSAERFVADPFDGRGGRLYRTGDLVRWRGDGGLEYLGRTDHQVKVRGFRIELGEIETQLLVQPGVREAVVVAAEGAAGARLLGYVSPRPGHVLDVDTLKAALGRTLPDYMVPGALRVLDGLPLNPNGKVDRSALPPPGAAPAAESAPPRGPVEQALAAIWAEVLGVAQVGRDDHFFEIGGHSLLAAQVASRVRLALGVELPLRRVFEHPVLRYLAAQLGVERTGAEEGAQPVLRRVPRRESMRLSPAQQRLWLVDRLLAPADRPAYNVSAALGLHGELDVAAVRAALDALLRRHEVLRTRFAEDDDGDPVALIVPEGSSTLDVPLQDLSGLPEAARGAAVHEALQAHARTVFDLARGPVFAAALLRTAPCEHLLLLCVHHIAFDGWSEAVFVREFVALYEALREGREAALAPLPVQYADYADWQHRKLEARQHSQAEFWRAYLKGAPALSTFAPDFARPKAASTEGARVLMTLPKPLSGRLGALARAQGTSLYTLLLAMFLLVLHRDSGAADVVVGTDIAGRDHPDLEPLIGFFVGVLPLRSRLTAPAGFADWLSQVHGSTLAAFEHQDLPFERIVELAGTPRSAQHVPLVQVLFVMQNMPASRFEIPGLAIQGITPPAVFSKFDLAVFASESDVGLEVRWVYASRLYRRETIERVADTWRDLLLQVADSPADAVQRFFQPITPEPSMPISTSACDDARRPPIRHSFLAEGREFPLVIEATEPGLDPVAWARAERVGIEQRLRRHGGILLRNFGLRTPQDFEAFAETIEPELYGSYGDLPKKEGGRKTYRSTPYPERQMILYHNESSHQHRWPRKQWFFCELPAQAGGATPIVDCREMLRRLPVPLVDEFERRGLLYVRTFHPHLDVSWQAFYKTDVRAEVEARLDAEGVASTWLDAHTLQTRTRCPAVIVHPLTRERVFFNQVQLHHPACLDAETREDLLDVVGAERLPRNVLFGDGAPIPDETMAVIGQAYEACAVRFDWRQGDVVMLDNMLAAHARDPYEGPRRIVVAMGAMWDRASLAQAAENPDAACAPAAQAAMN